MTDNTQLDTGVGGDVAATKEVSHSGDTTKVQVVQLVGISGTEGSYTLTEICNASGLKVNLGVDNDVVLYALTSAAGSAVAVTETDGALDVNMKAGTWTYGNYPTTWYLDWAGTAGASDNDVIYTSSDVSVYNYHIFHVTGTDAADVEISADGSVWSSAVAVSLLDDVTMGGEISVISIPTGKIGVLKGKFKKIRIKQNGATDANAFGAHSVI